MNGPQQSQNRPVPQMQPPPQQQVPTALTRFVGIVRALRGTAATAGILLIAAQLILPASIKPSELIGSLYGSIVSSESRTAQDMLARQTRKTTEAQALPPVIAQRLDQSLQTQSGIANLADFGCLVGQFIPSDDPQVAKMGQGLRDATCGLGDKMRKNMVDTLRQGTIQQTEQVQQQ